MMITIVRRALTVGWVAAVVGCLALVIFARVAHAVVILGGSMEPTIPRGSLIAPNPVGDDALHPGDVVTVRAMNGVLVTHRITRILDLADGPFLELSGDANAQPDPVLVPADASVGRVDWHVPTAGYLLGMLSVPPGLFSIVSLLAAGGIGLTLLDSLAADSSRRRRVGASRASPG